MSAVVLTARVSTRSVVGEKMFPPRFDPINERIAVSYGSSFLPRPLVRGTLLSGRFRTRTSRWWFELASLWVHPPLVVLQINTYVWRWFGSLRAGTTVLYRINRCNSHLCLLAASLLYEPFKYGEFFIAHFTLFNCVDKIADLLARHRNCMFQRVHLSPLISGVFLRSR